MARYVLYLDDDRIEVHRSWAGRCKLFLHGREVDSGTVHLRALDLRDSTLATNTAVHVPAWPFRRVTLLAEGQKFRVPRSRGPAPT